ncbi:hypothetical protein GCM10011316_15370 [Roseibium aquae]|uniref:DUF423 domain-containing protein n=1 Tax=Roseibium aquae TaxID=1323746 RepID=A0A916X062_9HYPH|nr:DUF423 domain-containing protein [Roseibium aquae]GGB44278.1 hypothetical protein GCM10011316_15370 [Roseibium aquae]
MNDTARNTPPGVPIWPLRASLVLSGVMGGLGVALLAASAHADPSGMSGTAAEMLLFHAPVVLALGILAELRKVSLVPLALGLLLIGLTLFCGDLVSRAYIGLRLFPMAAPTGGLLIIAGWAAIALSAFWIRPNRV